MKTFAEMLPTATREMREFVEAYEQAWDYWRDNPHTENPSVSFHATPPAKEPESVEGTVEYGCVFSDLVRLPEICGIKPGDRVKITKLENSNDN